MNVQIEASWREVLATEFEQPYFADLTANVREAYLSTRTVYPPPKHIFNAFAHTPFADTKVLILGQDPYINPGQAHGLSFSVQNNVQVPPSLQNIYKEITDDIGTPMPPNGNLERWADQGVLLLNSTLTVYAGQAGSHQSFGWETFTDAVIQAVAEKKEHVVFMLWGTFAQGKAQYIDATKHCVLKAPHPSPLAAYRGFFGCKHFSQCNEYLTQHGRTPIEW